MLSVQGWLQGMATVALPWWECLPLLMQARQLAWSWEKHGEKQGGRSAGSHWCNWAAITIGCSAMGSNHHWMFSSGSSDRNGIAAFAAVKAIAHNSG
jgi:hypothetical protein